MSYLRVNMVNHDTTEERDQVFERITNKAEDIFPEIKMMISIATSETSSMSIPVYENKVQRIEPLSRGMS